MKNISFFIIICLVFFLIIMNYDKINYQEKTNEPINLESLINQTESEKITGNKIQIEIQNGCGQRGVAKLYTNFLREKGYDIIGYKNAPHFNYNNTTIIVHQQDTSNFIIELLSILNINPNLVNYNYQKNSIYEMTLIIGKDYNILESFDEVSMYFEPF